MKTNSSKAKVMIVSFLALCFGVVSCYDDAALWEHIKALETNQIATINEQIDAIKSSITNLEATDKKVDALIQGLNKEDEELKGHIESLKDSIADLQAVDAALQETDAALKAEIEVMNLSLQELEAKDKELQECIDSLVAKDAVLEVRIEELKAYVDAELASTKDWANATFSTLDQYQATCDELAAIKVLIEEQEASLKQALTDAIAASETSMKEWVNEQLRGYWTIAETQAKLDTIKASTDQEVAAIKADLKTAKEELTAAYQSEIAKAIEESEGKLSAKIDEINSALDKRIGAIEARLDAIEEKLKVLDTLTRDFAIVFDDTEIGIVPGGTSSVSYTITGATETTTVKALGQGGWIATVTPDGTDKGTITVTAPDPITEQEIIVLAYDGEYRTVMSTLNFAKGYATPSQTAIEFGAEADTVSIELTSNLDYEVSIPVEAQSWLSVVESSATRAITTESISFACTECTGGIRKATVSFVDQAGVVVSTMTFIQQGSAVEVTLTEAGTLLEAIGQDVYKDIKGLIINGSINGTDVLTIRKMKSLSYLNMENAQIVAGGEAYYTNGNRKYFTENDIIGDYMFKRAPCFQEGSCEVILPKDVTSIGNGAFSICSSLTAINIPESVTSIGSYAFQYCTSLTSITIPKGVMSIDNNVFFNCSSLTAITLPEGVTSIENNAFSCCPSLKSIKVQSTTPPAASHSSFGRYTSVTLYVPEEAVSTYQNIEPWINFETIIGF